MLDTLAMASLLKGEYKEAFKKIDMYGGMRNMDQKIYEDRMMNLYDMFVEAQEEERPVDKLIGKDIEEFCKSYFDYSEEKKWYATLIKRMANIMAIIFVYCLLEFFLLSDEKMSFTQAEVNLLPIVVGIIAGFSIILFGRLVNKQVTFKKENLNPTPYYMVVLVIFIGCVICAPLLKDNINLSLPLDITLIISGVIAGVYYLVALILYLTKKDKHKMTKEEKAQRKAFEEELEFKSGIKLVAEGMATRYEKQMKKHDKKGKDYSHDDFVQSIRKEIRQEKMYNVVTGLLLGACVVVPVIVNVLKGEYVSAIVVFVLLFVIEALSLKWFVKFNKEQNISYNIILNECDERDITIAQYVEQME